MEPIVITTPIGRKAEDVFAFVSDFENNPRWQRGMRSCTWTSPPPHGAGSTYDQVARFLGRDIVSKFVVVEHEPPRRVKITTTESPFPITETRIVEPTGPQSCTVTAVVEGDASKVFRLFAPLLPLMVRRSVTRDYQRLRELLT